MTKFRVFYTATRGVDKSTHRGHKDYTADTPDDARTAFRVDHSEMRPVPMIDKVKRIL